MAMKFPTPPTQAPSRTLPRTSGSLSIALLRILARPLGDSASAAISGTTFERSRMPPLESMIPGFSRPRGPKRTSFMDSPQAEGGSGHQRHGIMRLLPAAGKEVRAVVGRMGSGQSAVRQSVSAKALVRCVSVAHRQQTLRILIKRAIYAAFSIAIGTFRGQDYRMHLVRAPSCKRRGFGGRQTMASPLLRAVPGHLV